MNRDFDLDPIPDLPPDLAELDAELGRFNAAERSSFPPELHAELEREWIRRPRHGGRRALTRRLVAASLAAVALTGLSVPPARASLVTGFQRLLDALQDATPVVPPPAPTSPVAAVGTPLPVDAGGAAPTPVPPPPEPRMRTVDAADELPAFRPARVTYPTLVDAGADRDLIRRHYPPELQREGVGGTVTLLLWVAEDGSVDNVQTRRNSGVPALDRAAMQGARSLRFHPATRDGDPVGTYVEFDLVFEPVEADWVPPEVTPVGAPELPPGATWELPEEGPLEITIPAPVRLEARDLLVVALGQPAERVEARLGDLDGLLAGEPPAGVSPLRWRADAARELERAVVRDPDNPAPALALARIRRSQGLRADARDLLARGLEGAGRGVRPVSPRLLAELHHELGTIVRESWLAWAGLGELPAEAAEAVACTRRGAGSGVETLVAWNYVCPAALGAAMASSFRPAVGGEAERDAMLGHFEAAVEAFPGHVGANVALLLDAADQELWLDVLNGARRFAWATTGHPYAFLLSGLALQRMGRSEEAMEDLGQALQALGPEREAEFRDPAVLAADGRSPSGDFWIGLDPILATEVNEREVEHLSRAAYAYLRFGGLGSDPARLWLRYGRPQTVRTFGTTDLRTEFWDYGQGPDLTLSRPANSDVRTYTPEAATYLQDLRSVFPHWYGTRARSLYSLPSQAARFRGVLPGTGEIEVRLEVPEALETFEGDSLDLGLFLLAADGTRLSETTRRIAGDSVRLRTGFGADAAVVVVELYNRRTHEAAALRLPAFRRGEAGEDPRLSDLLLVHPAAPATRDIGRVDPWVSPLARTDAVEGDRVGIFFELYDLPSGDDRFYRIRVELESEATGRIVDLPFRPGGQTLFGTEWTRSPAGRDGRAAEYLTLDVDGVAPDTYTLRAVVEDAEGRRVTAERRGVRVGTGGNGEPASTSWGDGLEGAIDPR